MSDWTECPTCRKPLYASDHDLGCPEEIDMSDDYQPMYEDEYDEFIDPLEEVDETPKSFSFEMTKNNLLNEVDNFLEVGSFEDLIRFIVENV